MLYNFIFMLHNLVIQFQVKCSFPHHGFCSPQAGAGCSSQCMKWWFRLQNFGLALLKHLSPLVGLAAFLCLITRQPDAAGLVTHSSPWDVSHLLKRVHITA